MRYQPTVNLWTGDNIQRLLDGRLKLQPGQWIYCGSRRPSRLCGVTNNGTIVATHYDGHSVSNESFKIHLQYWKDRTT